MQGKYIVIEGPDGAGKTTLAAKLYDYYLSLNKSIKLARQPGTTKVGEELRKVLKNPELNLSLSSQAALFNVDWYEFIQQYLRPNLKDGTSIITDRLALISGMIYQDEELVMERGGENCLHYTPKIDYLFILTAQPKKLLERVNQSRILAKDRWDGEALEGVTARYEKYGEVVGILLSRYYQFINSLYLIDTTDKTIDEVFECVKSKIEL